MAVVLFPVLDILYLNESASRILTARHHEKVAIVTLPEAFFPKLILLSIGIHHITPGSPGKFLMAAFVRPYAQRVTAEIYPVQLIVRASPNSAQEPYE